MKKPDIKRAAVNLWAAAMRHPDEPDLPPEMEWEMGYPDAIAACLEQDDYTQLNALLEKSRPIHPMLLPHLAEVIRHRGRPKSPGVKPKLTSLEKSALALLVQVRRRKGETLDDVLADIALKKNVSPETIKRAYEENVPTKYRPGQNRRRS